MIIQNLWLSEVFNSMSVPAPISKPAVTLFEGFAEASLIKLGSEPEFLFSVGVGALGTHLALAEGVLLAELRFLEVGLIPDLGLAVSEAALVVLGAVAS